MSAKLEYSLGLATNSFQAGIIAANQGLELFKKGLHLIGDVGEHAFQAISQGRGLRDLSARTGESVGNLYQLEKAFKESGVSGDNVAAVLFRFQKSLSGVGEMGESTAEAFQAIGVSMTEIARMDAPEAMLKMFQGINNLDRNSATGVAATIFGRGSAGDVLQLSRNWKDVAESIELSAKKAEIFQRNAELFTQVDKNLVKLKNSFKGLWLQVAEGIAPALNGIFASLANRDFPTLGKVLELSLTIAFKKAVNFFADAMVAITAAIPSMLKAGASAGGAIGDALVAAWADARATSEMSGVAHLPVGDPRREEAHRRAGMYGQLADEMRGESAAQVKEAVRAVAKGIKIGAGQAPLNVFRTVGDEAELKNLLKSKGLLPGPRGLPNAGGFTGLELGAPLKIDANRLEKVGALFGSGGGTDALTAARSTAANTRQIAQQQMELIRWLKEVNRDTVLTNK